jgi:hypothetical protein
MNSEGGKIQMGEQQREKLKQNKRNKATINIYINE